MVPRIHNLFIHIGFACLVFIKGLIYSHAGCDDVLFELKQRLSSNEHLVIGIDIDNTLVDGRTLVAGTLIVQVVQELLKFTKDEHHIAFQSFLDRLHPGNYPTEYTPHAWKAAPWSFPIEALPSDLPRLMGLDGKSPFQAFLARLSQKYDSYLMAGKEMSVIQVIPNLVNALTLWKPAGLKFITARRPTTREPTLAQIKNTGMILPPGKIDLHMGEDFPSRTSSERARHKAKQIKDLQLDIYIDDDTNYLRVIHKVLGPHHPTLLIQVYADPRTGIHQIKFYNIIK